MAVMRLDRFFSSQQLLSRTEIRPLLHAGLIGVNGTPARSPDCKIDPERDRITLRGEPVSYRPYVYLMLNKPPGVVSATDDKTHTTVLDLVPPALRREGLFPAGRLDRDTVGFVLLTNDGDFAHTILAPKSHVEKTYLARLDKSLGEAELDILRAGVQLADGTLCRPARVTLAEAGEEPMAEICLSEGKYHQIKRMFGVVGAGVNWLKRTKIGGLELDKSLVEGQCREIAHNDVDKILGK